LATKAPATQPLPHPPSTLLGLSQPPSIDTRSDPGPLSSSQQPPATALTAVAAHAVDPPSQPASHFGQDPGQATRQLHSTIASQQNRAAANNVDAAAAAGGLNAPVGGVGGGANTNAPATAAAAVGAGMAAGLDHDTGQEGFAGMLAPQQEAATRQGFHFAADLLGENRPQHAWHALVAKV